MTIKTLFSENTKNNITENNKADNKADIIIRPYNINDFNFIEHLQAKVFGPGRFARAAFRVREKFPTDNDLGLIALFDKQRVGSVSMTPISIAKINGYLLGPLVTDKDFRGLGIGKKLVQQVVNNALKNAGEFVLLVGDLPYYNSMGFQAVNIGSIKFPSPVDKERILIHCKDETLIDSLNGELAAFI